MEKAKIEIKVGIVEFSGEGEQDWLSKQLDKVLEKVPELLKIELANPSSGNSSHATGTEVPSSNGTTETIKTSSPPTNLVTFLKDKNASSNQVNKFLATAVFLQLNGKSRLTPSEVSQALKSSNQSKLANASDVLNKNVGKGYCEKDGTQFFVTQEGHDFVNQLK